MEIFQSSVTYKYFQMELFLFEQMRKVREELASTTVKMM